MLQEFKFGKFHGVKQKNSYYVITENISFKNKIPEKYLQSISDVTEHKQDMTDQIVKDLKSLVTIIKKTC